MKIDSILAAAYNVSLAFCTSRLLRLFFFVSFLQQLPSFFCYVILENYMIAVHLRLSWMMSFSRIKVLYLRLNSFGSFGVIVCGTMISDAEE